MAVIHMYCFKRYNILNKTQRKILLSFVYDFDEFWLFPLT